MADAIQLDFTLWRSVAGLFVIEGEVVVGESN